MSQAPRDENRIPSLLAASSSDGTTPVVVYADPTTHRLLAQTTIAIAPATSGGLTIGRNIDVDESGDLVGAAGAHQLYGWYLFNAASAIRYVKFYDKATAPVVGTDTPVLTIPLPAESGANVEYSVGIPFTLGIGIGATTAVADADTGAPGANEVIAAILYY